MSVGRKAGCHLNLPTKSSLELHFSFRVIKRGKRGNGKCGVVPDPGRVASNENKVLGA